jgi:hypothetical protein
VCSTLMHVGGARRKRGNGHSELTLPSCAFCYHSHRLHEAVGRRELGGTALIICGSTLAVVFGDHDVRTYTNDDLVALIGGAWFIVYALLVVFLCIWGMLIHRKVTPVKKQLVEAIRRYEIAVAEGDAQKAEWEDEVIARLEQKYKPWERTHPFALCALSGAFGAQSILFGKVRMHSECERIAAPCMNE